MNILTIDSIGLALVEVGKVILPALVAWIVGRQTIAIGRRQLEVASENARNQVAATVEAAKLGYRAQVLSANRQTWINDLRNICSETVGIMRGGQDARRSGEDMPLAKFEHYLQNKAKLELMLNPDEQESKEFLAALQKCEDLINTSPKLDEVIDAAFAAINRTCGVILKNEWERVKAGV